MAFLLNFITAICWMWGIFMGLAILAHIVDPDDDSGERIGQAFLFGILAWAWLIARYCF